MKKVKIYILTVMLLSIFIPSTTKAETASMAASGKIDESEQAQVLISRLMEIKSMNISAMSSSEKRDLRKEVVSIKGNLKKMEDGVYLSVGAIIIIILLLILLL